MSQDWVGKTFVPEGSVAPTSGDFVNESQVKQLGQDYRIIGPDTMVCFATHELWRSQTN